MDKIQLLYVKNIISRKHKKARQMLSFFMWVDNINYDKQVDVVWAGEDMQWQTLPVQFHSKLGNDKEYWYAEINILADKHKPLPGNIQFGLRYRSLDKEYWDNNRGLNYVSEADSGIQLTQSMPLLNIGFSKQLNESQKFIPITVAVDAAFAAEKVTIHWTTDNWQNTHKTPCHFKIDYWDKALSSNARNPNQYGTQIWKGWIKPRDAFRVQYSIACESKGQIHWDNNDGHNYVLSHQALKILILNLHCYQEDNQDYKFSQIAKAINELDVDVVCLQEVAELWNNGQGDWDTNSAKIIQDRLTAPFHLYTDWAHRGFDQYREGVAILSKYAMSGQDSKYVSDSHDPYSIHSRKVVMAQIKVPHMGSINVFSAHLSWWEDGFKDQFTRLSEWAESKQSVEVSTTLLCGDFNITAGSPGYGMVVDAHQYDDQFLAANSPSVFEKVFRVNDSHWQHYLAEDYRIDFIFMNKASGLVVTSANVLFTEQDYGRVSDHCGYLMTFEPK